MSYKVLYRKYRPQTFDDMVGQEQITDTLKSQLIAQKVSHAYLFTGSRGTGKTSCSKILAKAVNCLNLQNGNPCGVCENCIGIDNGSLMDVMEIDAASNNRVDDVRALIEEVAFTPASAKYRVYIIDEVHELSSSAFNALLKTLEEPPSHVIFILATTEVHKLLSTILSRCQRFDFRRITTEALSKRLKYICEKENATIDDDAALMIAEIADGGMRDAISLLDQCIGRNEHVSYETVEETAGIASKEHLFSLSDGITSKDAALCIEIVNDLYAKSKDLNRLCSELVMHFRHMMLIKAMRTKPSMIIMSDEEYQSLEEAALKTPLSLILHCMDSLNLTLDKMKYSNERVVLEMALIKLCSPELDSSSDALMRRIEALEQRKFTASPLSPLPVAKPDKDEKTPQIREPQNFKIEELSENAVPFTKWPEVIHLVKDYSMTVGMAFLDSAAYTSGDFMLVDGSDLAFDYLKTNPVYKDKLREAIYAVTGKLYKLGPYKKNKDKDNDDPFTALEKKATDMGIEVQKIEE